MARQRDRYGLSRICGFESRLVQEDERGAQLSGLMALTWKIYERDQEQIRTMYEVYEYMRRLKRIRGDRDSRRWISGEQEVNLLRLAGISG